jgi:hypothetical protein
MVVIAWLTSHSGFVAPVEVEEIVDHFRIEMENGTAHLLAKILSCSDQQLRSCLKEELRTVCGMAEMAMYKSRDTILDNKSPMATTHGPSSSSGDSYANASTATQGRSRNHKRSKTLGNYPVVPAQRRLLSLPPLSVSQTQHDLQLTSTNQPTPDHSIAKDASSSTSFLGHCKHKTLSTPAKTTQMLPSAQLLYPVQTAAIMEEDNRLQESIEPLDEDYLINGHSASPTPRQAEVNSEVASIAPFLDLAGEFLSNDFGISTRVTDTFNSHTQMNLYSTSSLEASTGNSLDIWELQGHGIGDSLASDDSLG